MPFYIRKSVKVAPGVRLNISKSGLGLSVGVRGARVSVGPRGTQINAGRGGLYYRKTLRRRGLLGRSLSLGTLVGAALELLHHLHLV